MHFRIADAWRAAERACSRERTNRRSILEYIWEREGLGGGRELGERTGGCEKGAERVKRVWKGCRVSGIPKGRTQESAVGWSDYLLQSKQDKLSVCISAWTVPITLFYPLGLYVDLLVGRWTRYFGVIYGPRHGAARCAVKLQNVTAGVAARVSEREQRLIPLKPFLLPPGI